MSGDDRSFQDLGKCRHCGKTWVIGDASVYGQKFASRRDSRKPGSLKCPFCRSENVRIVKEQM